jgi:hypothetical protein
MDKVEFIEKYCGIELLDYQKEVIKKLLDEDLLNPQLYILPARHCGRINYRLLEAILEWNELNKSSTIQD